jgi:hypothetical protein
MAEAVVTIDQRGGGGGALDRDVGAPVETARLDAFYVLRQAEHAVGIGAGEVCLGHQFGDARGIVRRDLHRDERVADESADRRRGDAARFSAGAPGAHDQLAAARRASPYPGSIICA